MPSVIRVHPNYGAAGGYGAAGPYAAIARMQLDNERETAETRLEMERALWQERMKTVQLQSALKYGSRVGAVGMSPYGALGVNPALLGAAGLGAVPGFPVVGGYGAGVPGMGYGGMPGVFGGLPLTGSGQSNPTNQSAVANGGNVTQHVTNANTYNRTVTYGGGGGGYAYGFPFGGSWLNHMLGW